jgi:hypothetical protein
VVFPEPDGPKKPNICPDEIENVIPSRADLPEKDLDNPLTSIMFIFLPQLKFKEEKGETL